MSRLDILAALDPGLRLDASVAERALGLLPGDGRAEILLMACLLLAPAADPREGGRALLDELEFAAGERDPIERAALGARSLAREMAAAARPSALHAALCSSLPRRSRSPKHSTHSTPNRP